MYLSKMLTTTFYHIMDSSINKKIHVLMQQKLTSRVT